MDAASPFVIEHGIPTNLMLFRRVDAMVLRAGRVFTTAVEEPFLVKARAPSGARPTDAGAAWFRGTRVRLALTRRRCSASTSTAPAGGAAPFCQNSIET